MQEAQTMLLQQAVEEGCNAVLSINCNVSTDSSGEHGKLSIRTRQRDGVDAANILPCPRP